MISYEKINCSEGVNLGKGENSVKCMICGYFYFKDVGFKYQPYVCNDCHDFYTVFMNLSDSKY